MSKKLNIISLIIIFVLFGFVRVISVYRSDIGFDLYDSPSYFNPTWSYPIRMPFITYLFAFLSYFSAIVLIQTIFGIISWILLAFAVSSLVKTLLLKFFSIIIVLSLGITAPIVGFDTIILSESLTFSIFNCIMAMIILYYKNKSIIQLLMLLLFIVFYSGTKQTSAHLGLVIVLLISIFVLSNLKSIRNVKYHISLLVVAIFASSFFIWLARQNNEISGNVEITNIIERTFDDYESQKWYLNRGFPGIAYQAYSSKPFKRPIDLTRSLPQVKSWEMYEKKSPIEIFAINHPLFLIFGPLKPNFFVSTFTDNESVLVSLARGYRLDKNYSVINLKTSEMKPFFLAKLNLPTFFWWSDNIVIQKYSLVMFLSFIIFFLAIPFIKNYGPIQTSNTIVSHLLFIFLFAVWSNWHISVTYELDRYLMPWAVELRIIFIISLAVTIDAYVKRKFKDEN